MRYRWSSIHKNYGTVYTQVAKPALQINYERYENVTRFVKSNKLNQPCDRAKVTENPIVDAFIMWLFHYQNNFSNGIYNSGRVYEGKMIDCLSHNFDISA